MDDYLNNYYVVKDRMLEHFTRDLSEMLNRGWVPVGGMTTDGTYYYQAMMKGAVDTTNS